MQHERNHRSGFCIDKHIRHIEVCGRESISFAAMAAQVSIVAPHASMCFSFAMQADARKIIMFPCNCRTEKDADVAMLYEILVICIGNIGYIIYWSSFVKSTSINSLLTWSRVMVFLESQSHSATDALCCSFKYDYGTNYMPADCIYTRHARAHALDTRAHGGLTSHNCTRSNVQRHTTPVRYAGYICW